MAPSQEFEALVHDIGRIGRAHHEEALERNAYANLRFTRKSIRDLPVLTAPKKKAAIVVSAGPSLHNRDMIRRIIASNFDGTIVAIDASLQGCLREGLIPDFVLTLDPHPTRVVRWFGDPNLAENTKNDDYFVRQDLDVAFRKDPVETNQRNIEMFNKYGPKLKVVVASSAPANVVARLVESGSDMYWWNPLVDDPAAPGSLTRRLYEINRLPAFNSGGNVGSASWTFAATKLKVGRIGLVGMDLGYYADTPKKLTQAYYELIKHNGGDEDIGQYFTDFVFPLTGEKFYTDPTYFWYRRNLLQLLERAPCRTYNCTEGGTLFGDGLTCTTLEEFCRLG